jgi:DNA repair protein RecO (recombination protein O)
MSAQKSKAIVLGFTKLSESKLILKCFTRNKGIISFLIRSVHTKNAIVKPSMLRPLSTLEIDFLYQQNKNLQYVKEVRNTPVFVQLHTDIHKLSIAQFWAELLTKVIKSEHVADEELFDEVFNYIQHLETANNRQAANLSVHFWARLIVAMGYAPILSNESMQSVILDMIDVNPFLDSQSTRMLDLLLHFYQHPIHLLDQILCNKSERVAIIDFLIKYFEKQSGDQLNLKTLDVLVTIFAE